MRRNRLDDRPLRFGRALVVGGLMAAIVGFGLPVKAKHGITSFSSYPAESRPPTKNSTATKNSTTTKSGATSVTSSKPGGNNTSSGSVSDGERKK